MKFFTSESKKSDIILMAGLAVFAALVYFPSVADYLFPGESARLAIVWRALDVADYNPYPLMALFAKGLGAANILAPVMGLLAVVVLYLLVNTLLRARLLASTTAPKAYSFARVGGLVAAIVFALTPAVREAATHFEPRLFDTLWAMLACAALIPLAGSSRALGIMSTLVAGIMVGLGFSDSLLFIYLLPLYIISVWVLSSSQKQNPGAALAAFIVPCALTAAIFIPCTIGDFGAFIKAQKMCLRFDIAAKSSLVVPCFAVVPALVALVASRRAYTKDCTWMGWFFNMFMTVLAIIAYASPLAPSSAMRTYGVLPVAASAFAAFLVAYVVVYWLVQITLPIASESGVDEKERRSHFARPIGLAVGGIFALVMAVALFINCFLGFDGARGKFADIAAEKIIADLGAREWFVTDGTLDNHLLYAANKAGKKLHLICLQRDMDEKYLARLGELVKSENIMGENTANLALSLELGVWPFVQDWFAADSNIVNRVAVFGTPDLWLYAHKQPVPEFLFFGADPARLGTLAAWAEYDKLLAAPKGWGSHRIGEIEDPVERQRLNLRRHLGLIANDLGFYLQSQKKDAEAFAMYELVLNSIDSDNISALFNELGMADAGFDKARAKQRDLTKQMKAIVADSERRYRLGSLSVYYGYIRNAELFARLGLGWARSGLPGEGLNQIRRAIDFIPTDSRVTMMNMMAALYASDNQQKKSREIYRDILAKDAANHDALIGLTRLELLDGNLQKAVGYLEQATEAGGDDARAQTEKALLLLMKNDTAGAKKILRRLTDAHEDDMQAWSFLAATVMRQIDETKDATARAKYEKELEKEILPAMEKQARSADDYYLLTTRAFVMMRKDDVENRRAARDAFVVAARNRPDLAGTRDIILGLDIQLDDTVDAEAQAKQVLKSNRRAPLANYVLGSIALRNGRYAEAEGFLRRSVDNEKPLALALNDLAEVLRRGKRLGEAVHFARKATETDPKLYVAWETLASSLLDGNGNLDEAEKAAEKAVELSKGENGRETDVRMLITLARVQFARGDVKHARTTIIKVRRRLNELSPYEQQEFKEFADRVK